MILCILPELDISINSSKRGDKANLKAYSCCECILFLSEIGSIHGICILTSLYRTELRLYCVKKVICKKEKKRAAPFLMDKGAAHF